MFTSVSVGYGTKNASSTPPSLNDCSQILFILNQKYFSSRILPQGNILKFIQNIYGQLIQQNKTLICHTVARNVAYNFCDWGWQRVPGYLVRNSININFINQIQPIENPPFFTIDCRTKQVVTWLHHHSIVRDNAGNYIECLPADHYPLNEFIFIPHQSGKQGYCLRAY